MSDDKPGIWADNDLTQFVPVKAVAVTEMDDAPVDDEDSNLVKHAQRELTLAGLTGPDSDYNGMLGEAALEIVRVFSRQGHSGYSAAMVTDIVQRLMRYEPLTPLTYGPEEWYFHEGLGRDGDDVWQNIRKSSVFSIDGGKTHYDLDDDREVHDDE